ncbi:hypothetical protein ACFQJC_16435 [Haloferax namakaokahaiae]|uniref:Uncharacterized protein n=1 Tax=Haloferax namakaokahaiae TaxID=1748331 RepID=A0ABD5ZJ96_9EURY
MTTDIYRCEIVNSAAIWDLTEFDAAGGLVLQEFFETLEAVLQRPDISSSMFVLSPGLGISKWFFERLSDLLSRVPTYGIQKFAFVGPKIKQAAIRAETRDSPVPVETPDSKQTALDWVAEAV